MWEVSGSGRNKGGCDKKQVCDREGSAGVARSLDMICGVAGQGSGSGKSWSVLSYT